MQINNVSQLIEFVESAESIEVIEKVVTASIGVHFVLMENTPIQEVKKLVLDFIEQWQEQGNEIPLFLINNYYTPKQYGI
jgi:predicted glycoside hydrolase/deacetylase ChbG (UPF0249 family)